MEETMCIQLDVLCQARGLPRGLVKLISTSSFSTFEGSLPFSAMFVNNSTHTISDTDLVRNPEPPIRPSRRNLTCRLCPAERAFKVPDQLWVHYRIHHAPRNKEEEAEMIEEMFRSTTKYVDLWRARQVEKSDRSFVTTKKFSRRFPGSQMVAKRLQSMLEKAVDWDTFCTWRLQTWGRMGVAARHVTSPKVHQ